MYLSFLPNASFENEKVINENVIQTKLGFMKKLLESLIQGFTNEEIKLYSD